MISHIRFALFLSVFLVIGYSILDTYVYTTEFGVIRAICIRVFLVIPPILVLLSYTYRNNYFYHSQLIGSVCIAVVGFAWFVFSYNSNTLVIVYNFPAIIMTTCYCFFFIGLFFSTAFITSLCFNIVYCIAIWSAVDIPFPIAIGTNTSLLVVFFLLAMASYQKELISRQLFVTETRERESILHQVQNDRRYLNWLRELARFLRHEVRQPVAQINSSIEIIELSCKDDSSASTQISSAKTATRHVWNLIERASRATDIQAFIKESYPEVVCFNRIMCDLLEGFAQYNEGVVFSFHDDTVVNIYADPMLIKEAAGNVLSNAISYADDGSTIDLYISNTAKCVSAIIINRGPTIDGNPEDLFNPFTSTRASPSSEHHGLGLYLVQLIVSYYGGKATIGNLPDGSGVEVTMSFPRSD